MIGPSIGVTGSPSPGLVHSISWGDVPTWLAVIGAFVGAVVALRQLRGQQKDIARQTRILERRQGDQIDVTFMEGWTPSFEVPYEDIPQIPGDHVFATMVHNKSDRPIRNVVCMVDKDDGGNLISAKLVGRVSFNPEQGPILMQGTKNGNVPLVRAGERCGFIFPVGRDANPNTRFILRFTDDAGLDWQINNDLHLEKLTKRDW